MIALAEPDTRITEGMSEKGISTPALVVSNEPQQDVKNISPLSFKPKLMNREVTNDTGFKKLFQFPVDPLWSNYYTVLRATGYSFNALFPTLKNKLDIIFPESFDKEGNLLSVTKHEDTATQKAREISFSPMQESKRTDPNIKKILYIETAAFTGIAGYYCFRDFKNLFENCKLALAAELGKQEQDVSWKDLFNTDNPIISTEASRLAWKTALRLGSGASYAYSLEAGLLLAVANISAERTVFNVDTAYDMATKIVNDVQLNHLTGNAAHESIINGLQRITQRTTVDHNRTPMGEDELQSLRPIFADIAQDIIDKKISVSSVIGYLGGGIIIPGEPEQSRANYDHVKQHGLAGMAAEGEQLRKKQQVAEGQPIWHRYEPEITEERSDVAESAKREKTLSDRYGLDAARSTHLGSSLTR